MMTRTIAIGDVHGCPKALDAVIGAVEPAADDVVVALGDYVDRGPDSRGVIERLISLSGRCRLVPLIGNHEQMMLEALNNRGIGTWLMSGGVATLDSYGAAADLGRIDPRHVAFIRSCLDFYETDGHIFVHARYDPDLPMHAQPILELRWEFLRDDVPPRHRSQKRVITGHTSQKSGEILDLRHVVCIDTYCHGGGWLTALDVESGTVWQADRHGRMRGDR